MNDCFEEKGMSQMGPELPVASSDSTPGSRRSRWHYDFRLSSQSPIDCAADVLMLPLERLIAQPLKALGFKKKSRTWWRHHDETIQVLNLQKSSFGERLYINLGVYVKALGTEDCPPEHRCHVRVRLEKVSEPEQWRVVASAGSSEEPRPELVAAVLVDGVAWLDRLSTLTGIRGYVESGGSEKGLILATVRQLVAACP